MTELHVYFVLPKGITSDEDLEDDIMREAFCQCDQYSGSGIKAEWITDKASIKKTGLTKKDVFVLHDFSGPVFNKLQKTKALVVGPRCLSCCLAEGSPIPPGFPIFTIAMRGLYVVISGMKKHDKEKLRNKVQWMGGAYNTILTNEVTHLISDTVLSDKYHAAVAAGVTIMHADWVEAVWRASLTENVSGSDPRFESHRLPPFFGLQVTTSACYRQEKKKISGLIDAHGGAFHGNFESETTDVVVMDRNGIGSEKHKAAVEHDKILVSPQWVYDSVEQGKCQPFDRYKVGHCKTSSPNQDLSKLPDMSLNLSTITNIRNPSTAYINETSSTTMSSEASRLTVGKAGTSDQRSSGSRVGAGSEKEAAMLVDAIDMKEVKRAGAFLDGCCMYVHGFTPSHRDKLQRLVPRAGGVHYDQPHASVTHALCAHAAVPQSDMEEMPRAVCVGVKWLTDGIKAGQCLNVKPYLIKSDTAPSKPEKRLPSQSSTPGPCGGSPMSKLNVQLLRGGPAAPAGVERPPVPLFRLEAEEPQDNEIVQQYLSQNPVGDSEDTLAEYVKQGGASFTASKNQSTIVPEGDLSHATIKISNVTASEEKADKTVKQTATVAITTVDAEAATSNATEDMEDQSELFVDIKFELQGMDSQSMVELVDLIENCGGTVVEAREGADYVVVPLEYDEEDVKDSTARIITTLWLDDCCSQNKIVEVEYYHRPVKTVCGAAPLQGLMLAISTYMASERVFISELAQLAKAETQVLFCRRDTARTKASTHLICPVPSGAKYAGAVKWGLPCVTAQWLMECVRTGRRVREGPYLVGDTKEPIYEDDNSTNVTNMEKSVTDTSNKENHETGEHQELEEAADPAADLGITLKEEEASMREEVQQAHPTTRKSVSSPAVQRVAERTPKRKSKLSLGGMSPASRYIAMARQGLLGCDSQETPNKETAAAPTHNESFSTPPMDNVLSTPNLNLYSANTRRKLLAIKRGEAPSSPLGTPSNPFDSSVATPDSAFGALLGPETTESRKKLWKFCQELPSPANTSNKKETPMSELCRRYLSKTKDGDRTSSPLAPKQLYLSDSEETPPTKHRKLTESNTPSDSLPLNPQLENQLKQLNSMLTGGADTSRTPTSGLKKRSLNTNTPSSIHKKMAVHKDAEPLNPTGCVESQTDTVGWDDVSDSNFRAVPIPSKEVQPRKVYRFMMSQAVENRSELEVIIKRLGGTTSDSQNWDASVTHLLCTRVTRSERVMTSMAAGIWILHPAYLTRSNEAGRFLDEEDFEWGNSRSEYSRSQTSADSLMLSCGAHRWRSARSSGLPQPFHQMTVCLLMLPARMPAIQRLIVAGGGEVITDTPPFGDDADITLCISEPNKLPVSSEVLEYLVTKRIPLCSPLFISKILIEEGDQDPMENLLPIYKNLINQ